jgi:hypothetical protein
MVQWQADKKETGVFTLPELSAAVNCSSRELLVTGACVRVCSGDGVLI